ncbi:L-threonylcarbamoyladenylate synthase [Malassezia sp. CBS 17886]|nr:L-threonylcarbamoyladenylate synthase [Malassezia sp. CBS 17886]
MMPPVTTEMLRVPHAPGNASARAFGLTLRDGRADAPEPWYSLAVAYTDPATEASVETAAAHLRAGELVAFPTETVYGLGANALRADAAEKIYGAKNRPADNPLIVHVADVGMLERLLPAGFQVSRVCDVLVRAFWPGPLTLLFPVTTDDAHATVPPTVTCGQSTVGVRMPSHPLARAIIAKAGVPIAAPSANASGRPSPTRASHVYEDMATRGVLRYIVDGGECSVGVESTVVDAVSHPGEVRVLRPGGVSVEQLAATLKEHGLLCANAAPAGPDAVRLRVYGRDLARSAAAEATPSTPGMKYRHYSPNARVVLLRRRAAAGLPTLHDAIVEEVAHVNMDAHATEANDRVRSGDDLARVGPHRPRIGVLCTSDDWLWRALEPLATEPLSRPAPPTWLSRPVRTSLGTVCVYSLGETSSPEAAAQRLFDGLRTLDAGVAWSASSGMGPCDLILVEEVGDAGVGLAVMNRLEKAASDVVDVQ